MYTASQREVWPLDNAVVILNGRTAGWCDGEVEYQRHFNHLGTIEQKDISGELTPEKPLDVEWFDGEGIPEQYDLILADDERVVRLYGLLAANDPDEEGKVEFVAMDATERSVT